MAKRFTEVCASSLSASVRVDREAGVIRNVKIVGLTSRNGRRYLPEALRSAIGLYEDARAYLNHPRKRDVGEDRPFESWVGVLRGVRFADSGLFGDLHLRKASSHFDGICEAAERFPCSFGLSHEVDGDYRSEDGVDVIDRIDAVFGVAVVCEPGATNGLFESCGCQRPTHDWRSIEKQLVEIEAGVARYEERVGRVVPDVNGLATSDPDFEKRFRESVSRSEAWLRQRGMTVVK